LRTAIVGAGISHFGRRDMPEGFNRRIKLYCDNKPKQVRFGDLKKA
jgi:hypothetical protein